MDVDAILLDAVTRYLDGRMPLAELSAVSDEYFYLVPSSPDYSPARQLMIAVAHYLDLMDEAIISEDGFRSELVKELDACLVGWDRTMHEPMIAAPSKRNC